VKHDVGALNIEVIDGSGTVKVCAGMPATVRGTVAEDVRVVGTPATRTLEDNIIMD